MTHPHDPEVSAWMGMDTDREELILAGADSAAA
jgi:hypothetical protein